MARRKAGDKKVTGRKVDIPNVQADDHSIAFEELHVAGNVGGDIRIGHTIGYTAEQVSILLTQITTTLQPKKFDGRCPYKGLEVFEEEDAGLFFGRERLVTELVGRVKESRTVFITGPSGSGKSSLVRAGLIHSLKQGGIKSSERWLYETMKPGREPLKDLALAFSRLKSPELQDYFLAHVGETDILNKCVESVLSGRKDHRFLLFIDQFEEIFTQINSEEERIAFINMLAHAGTMENGRVMVLFAMRSDFVSNCATYPALNELLSQKFRQIGAMQPEELVSAIALPARHVGLPIEDELIARIINDMKGEPDALPLMQFALKDLFDSEQEKGGVIALTLKDYLGHGGIHKSLERHADATFAKLSESEQELTRSIFSGLIEIGRGTQDTKRTALFDELIPANTNAEEVGAIVQKLADARLIITDEQAGRDTVTISHEKLIEAWPWLKKLVNENRDVIALQNEIANDAKEWEEHQREQSYLYTGARLAIAQEKIKNLTLSETSQTFLKTGIKTEEDARQKSRRIQRRILTGSFVFSAIVLGLLIFALIQLNISRAQQLGFQAQVALAEQSYNDAALYAYQASQIHQNDAADLVLSKLAYENFVTGRSLSEHADTVSSVAWSADGRLASASWDNTVILWDLSTGEPAQTLKGHTYYVYSVAWSADGRLASGSVDNTVILWDLSTGEPAQTLKGHTDYVSSVAWSADGRLASGSGDNTVILWDLSTGEPAQTLKGHTGSVSSVAWSADGRLASGSGDNTVILWDLTTGEPAQTLKGHTDYVTSVAWSADGRLASGSWDTVILWDLSTVEPAQTLKGHTDYVSSVAWSADGRL
ncbi:MAG: WD40 repeat domain-containing protein, partial [Anaerolineales bacterium]